MDRDMTHLEEESKQFLEVAMDATLKMCAERDVSRDSPLAAEYFESVMKTLRVLYPRVSRGAG